RSRRRARGQPRAEAMLPPIELCGKGPARRTGTLRVHPDTRAGNRRVERSPPVGTGALHPHPAVRPRPGLASRVPPGCAGSRRPGTPPTELLARTRGQLARLAVPRGEQGRVVQVTRSRAETFPDPAPRRRTTRGHPITRSPSARAGRAG